MRSCRAGGRPGTPRSEQVGRKQQRGHGHVSEAAGDRSAATTPSSGVCQTTSTETVPVRASACSITGESYAAQLGSAPYRLEIWSPACRPTSPASARLPIRASSAPWLPAWRAHARSAPSGPAAAWPEGSLNPIPAIRHQRTNPSATYRPGTSAAKVGMGRLLSVLRCWRVRRPIAERVLIARGSLARKSGAYWPVGRPLNCKGSLASSQGG